MGNLEKNGRTYLNIVEENGKVLIKGEGTLADYVGMIFSTLLALENKCEKEHGKYLLEPFRVYIDAASKKYKASRK